jgi:methylated-DNA-[protein]-cysteine S-methyltransferase
MTTLGFTVFDSEMGPCGLAWSEHGVCAVHLPDRDAERVRARLLRRTGSEETDPPPGIRTAVRDVQALLAGEPKTLDDIAVDLGDASEFNRKVWAITRAIPPGETLTYGEVARRIGEPGAARAVGKALGENPIPIIVPCHRVLAAGGGTGGFSGGEGVETKLRLLTIERARTGDAPLLFDDLPLAAKPRR